MGYRCPEPIMSLGYFILPKATSDQTLPFFACLLFICFLLWPLVPWTLSITSGQIVEKISSRSLRKDPLFFLLASDPSNFGRGSTVSDKVRLQATVNVKHAGKFQFVWGKKFSFFWDSVNYKNPLLPLSANVACDLNGTPAGCLMTKQTHLNFCYLWDFI